MRSRPPALWEVNDTLLHVGWMIPVSLVVHGALAVVVIVFGALGASKPLPPPNYEVMLIAAPIKKGTPGGGAAKTVEPPPSVKDAAAPPTPPPATAPTVVAKAAPDEMTVPTKKDVPAETSATARADALERLKREAALKRVASAAKAQGETNAAATAPPSVGGPPATTTGGSGEGAGDGGSEYGVDWSTTPGAATYQQQLQAIVNENWLPPTWIDVKDPKLCIITVLIGFDGKITSMEFEQRSGNAAFDASAMAALRKSDPLPPAPIDLKSSLAKHGIDLRFDSRTKLAVGAPPQ